MPIVLAADMLFVTVALVKERKGKLLMATNFIFTVGLAKKTCAKLATLLVTVKSNLHNKFLAIHTFL